MKTTSIEFKTMPFNKFLELRKTIKRLPGDLNRPVVESHVERLKEIMEKNGFDDVFKLIRTNVFSKSKQYSLYCGDGNHRLEGIGDLKLEQHIPMVILTLNTLEEIIDRVATWNNAGKKWTLGQYLNTWASAEYNDYVQLKHILKKYKYSMSPMIEAFGEGTRHEGRTKDFEEGKFKIDVGKGNTIINIYIDAIMAGLKDSLGAFGAVVRFWNRPSEVDRDIFIEIIQKRKYIFSNIVNRDLIIVNFTELYNKQVKSKTKHEARVRVRTLAAMAE